MRVFKFILSVLQIISFTLLCLVTFGLVSHYVAVSAVIIVGGIAAIISYFLSQTIEEPITMRLFIAIFGAWIAASEFIRIIKYY